MKVLLLLLTAFFIGCLEARDNVVFFGAHPDDFEAGMGLALRMRGDYDVHIVDFTRGEGGCGEQGFRDGSTAEKRMAEEGEVARAFGTEPIFLSQVNFQGRYAYANEKVTKEIEDLLLKLRPKAVFTNWPIDTHPDHVQCTAAVQHALHNVKRDSGFSTELYFYEEPPWETLNFRPAYHVDITSEIGEATNLIARYACQNGAKIARDKLGRVARQGREAPRRVAYAERYTTATGRQIPGGVLDRYAIKAPLVVLHLDFNTIQMRKETVVGCLREAARMGYNAVLWEVEDKIRWEACPECVHPEAFTKDEFRAILDEARRLNLEPIPLLQTFGHAEYVLMNGGHGDWMEDPEFPACYCVSKPEVRTFLRRMLSEYLELFGDDVRHFHLGGDEAKAFCTCPVCSKRERMELYAEHLRFLAEPLLWYDIKPGIWCDMVLGDADAFRKANLPRSFTVWHWDYVYDGKGNKRAWTDRLDVLEELGHEVIFTVSSSSAGDGPFLPRYGAHMDNVAAAAELVRRKGMRGLCMSSWSVRKFPKLLQYPIWEFAARRLLDPASDPGSDERAAYSRFFGSTDPSILRMMTEWYGHFVTMDASGWLCYIKNAKPAPKGTFDRVVREEEARNPRHREDVIGKTHEIEAKMTDAARRFAATGRTGGCGAVLDEGVALATSFVRTIRASYEGAVPSAFPVRETTDFYLREQTSQSASNCANVVWSVLKNR